MKSEQILQEKLREGATAYRLLELEKQNLTETSKRTEKTYEVKLRNVHKTIVAAKNEIKTHEIIYKKCMILYPIIVE